MMEVVEVVERSLEGEAAEYGEVTSDVWLTTRWPAVEVEGLGRGRIAQWGWFGACIYNYGFRSITGKHNPQLRMTPLSQLMKLVFDGRLLVLIVRLKLRTVGMAPWTSPFLPFLSHQSSDAGLANATKTLRTGV